MPKAVVKPATKATAANPSESDKAAAEKAKVTRLRIVESQIPKVAKLFSGVQAAEKKAASSSLDAIRGIKVVCEESEFTKDEAKHLITGALAKVYTDGDAEAISAKPDASPEGKTAASMRSRFLGILYCADAKRAKVVAKMLDDDEVSLGTLYGVSTGLIDPAKAQKKGKHGGARTPGQSGQVIEDIDTFKNQFSALIGKAWNGDGKIEKYKGGFSLEELEEAAQATLLDYTNQLEAVDAEA